MQDRSWHTGKSRFLGRRAGVLRTRASTQFRASKDQLRWGPAAVRRSRRVQRERAQWAANACAPTIRKSTPRALNAA